MLHQKRCTLLLDGRTCMSGAWRASSGARRRLSFSPRIDWRCSLGTQPGRRFAAYLAARGNWFRLLVRAFVPLSRFAVLSRNMFAVSKSVFMRCVYRATIRYRMWRMDNGHRAIRRPCAIKLCRLAPHLRVLLRGGSLPVWKGKPASASRILARICALHGGARSSARKHEAATSGGLAERRRGIWRRHRHRLWFMVEHISTRRPSNRRKTATRTLLHCVNKTPRTPYVALAKAVAGRAGVSAARRACCSISPSLLFNGAAARRRKPPWRGAAALRSRLQKYRGVRIEPPTALDESVIVFSWVAGWRMNNAAKHQRRRSSASGALVDGAASARRAACNVLNAPFAALRHLASAPPHIALLRGVCLPRLPPWRLSLLQRFTWCSARGLPFAGNIADGGPL